MRGDFAHKASAPLAALIITCWTGAYAFNNAAVSAPIPAAIRIKGDAAFRSEALKALRHIRRTSTGSRLFADLSRTKSTVTIRFAVQEFSGAYMLPIGDGDSVILWNPRYSLDGHSLPFLPLYHELVHALHEANGERVLSDKEEEERTVGLGKYADYALSENALRRELKLPLRKALGHEPH